LLSTCVDREEYGHQHLEKEERIKDEERKKKGKERGKKRLANEQVVPVICLILL
jgi:hypothetical protein